MKTAFFAALLLLLPVAHSAQSPAGGLSATMTLQPQEVYANKLAIISFDFRGANGDSVTHIDGYVDILRADTVVVKDYYLHTHNDDFSMLHTFSAPGTYKVVVSVRPSEHYRGWEFEPGNASFDIIVKEQKQAETKNSGGHLFVGAGVFLILALAVKSALKR